MSDAMTFDDLTIRQQMMLRRFFVGDMPVATIAGYHWESDPFERVDLRTLKALVIRGYIDIGRLNSGRLICSQFQISSTGEDLFVGETRP